MLAAFLASGAWAADTPSPPPPEPKPKDLQIDQARAAIAHGDWLRARDLLREAVAREPRNADVHNLYAYAIRRGPSPSMDLVFRHYNEALRLDPAHRGAHEYLGEAYLISGNLAKAKEHLALLEQLCGSGCEEATKLRMAIAGATQKHAKH